MIKRILFVGQGWEAKLDKFSDALLILQEHIVFAALDT